ncbi:MAG: hypothetical protein ACLPYY_11555 [Acidimicrobiales bacterium]
MTTAERPTSMTSGAQRYASAPPATCMLVTPLQFQYASHRRNSTAFGSRDLLARRRIPRAQSAGLAPGGPR